MSDILIAPLIKLPWYKRTWGIIILILLGLGIFFFTWFGYQVYTSLQLMRSGKLKPITNFGSDFTETATKLKTAGGVVTDIAPKTSPSRGEEDARVTVVEFADFQCPYSQKEFSIIRPLMETIGGVKFVYRNFPLSDIHPDAIRASEASLCAQEQGKFWAFHDQVYVNAAGLAEDALKTYARNIGLDEEKFRVCLKSEKYKAQVLKDLQDGIALGVRGTPTFFINGVKFEGAIPTDAWKTIFDRLKSF